MQPFRVAFGAAALAVAVGAGVFLWKRDAADEARVRGLRDYNCDEPGKVYFGRLPLIRRPASVASSDVYARIPEYLRIRTERISAETPLYTLLMKKASDAFLAAVAEVARAHDHDVVAERGAIHRGGNHVPEVPDRTQEVLAALVRR